MQIAYLIRHAHAGDRHAWSGDDKLRPLSEKGRRQGKNLAKQIGDAPPRQVLSSPATRCIQTVEPLAKRIGVEVEIRKELREGADPSKLIALIEETIRSGVALCGHGDVIPEVVDLLARRGMAIEGPAGNNKGSWWELRHDGGQFVSARWHPPA
jgi:8-oxo-dGTP diphosphatase